MCYTMGIAGSRLARYRVSGLASPAFSTEHTMADVSKVEVGDEIRATIIDHSAGDEEMVFVVYGRVAKVRQSTITVDAWGYADENRERDDNVESFTLVKSAIIDLAIFSDT